MNLYLKIKKITRILNKDMTKQKLQELKSQHMKVIVI
ncbi:MAG: hypothetical protein ACLSG7_00770 [Clostridia bacterium]